MGMTDIDTIKKSKRRKVGHMAKQRANRWIIGVMEWITKNEMERQL